MVAPTRREHRELPNLAHRLGYDIEFDDYDWAYFDDPQTRNYHEPLKILDRIADLKDKYGGRIDGITSAVGYPGMSVVSILARQLQLPGPDPDAIMRCEHKYYSRAAQQELVPEATASFTPLNIGQQLPPGLSFPRFLKPIKSFMSMNAQRVESEQELLECLDKFAWPEDFVAPFDEMVAAHTCMTRTAQGFLLEELLEGQQVSLEGFVYKGQPQVLGIVDAVMFPGTISFKRWMYPSRLPADVQNAMKETAVKFFSGINYDHAMFNMELFYNPATGRIHIIEVNPKIASQFPDLFQRVDGTSSYELLLQLAAGDTPRFEHGKGDFAVAASCVLRTFQDQMVLSTPSPEDLAFVKQTYPDAIVEIMATPGHKLSQRAQDAQSFRYGLVNIGGRSEEDLEKRFEWCKENLHFEFQPVETTRTSGLRAE